MDGDTIHETDYLKVTKKVEGHRFYYKVDFMGDIGNYYYDKESIDEIIEKRTKAYNLIPSGAKIIPRNLIGMCEGLLIGGILEDSLYAVYGLCEGKLNSAGIRGFSCSVFWFPTDEELSKFTDFNSLVGDFKIKQ